MSGFDEIQWSGELLRRCGTCEGAGTVWARAHAFPTGFLRFCGSSLPRSDDRKHVEIVCPTCDGHGSTHQTAERSCASTGATRSRAQGRIGTMDGEDEQARR